MKNVYFYCRAILLLAFVPCMFISCGVSKTEEPEETISEIISLPQEQYNSMTSISEEGDVSDFTPIKEDYDDLRRALPYEPFFIDYANAYYQNGYLELDKTAGVLESYLGFALMGLREKHLLPEDLQDNYSLEIPDILLDNYLIFQTAGFCTHGFSPNEYPLFERPLALYAIPKEHLDLTVQYLYGDECAIDYSNLITKGHYIYEEESGLAFRYGVKKSGLVPTVLHYEDLGDHFQATIVFLTWHNMLEDGELSYYDESAQSSDNEEIILNSDNAKDFCYSGTPDKYSVRIDKGEGEELYLRSVLQATDD